MKALALVFGLLISSQLWGAITLSTGAVHLPPYIIYDGDKLTGGVIPRIYALMKKKYKIDIKMKKLPIGRFHHLALQKKFDIMFMPLDHGVDIPGYVKLIDVYYSSVGLLSTDPELKKQKKYQGKKVCIVPNSPFKIEDVALITITDYESCMKMLKHKRVDYVLGSKEILESYLKAYDKELYAQRVFTMQKVMPVWVVIKQETYLSYHKELEKISHYDIMKISKELP